MLMFCIFMFIVPLAIILLALILAGREKPHV